MTRAFIPQRRRIFIACEGPSEEGYGGLLQRLCRAQGLPVHLVKAVYKGGSPLDIAKYAGREADKENKKVPRFVLLDRDRLADTPGEEAATLRILTQARITPIWQAPDHEGFLLRHFDQHDHDDPPRGQAESRLQKIWPDYRKGMAAVDLARRLGVEDVQRAARVTPGLSALLTILGLTS